MGEMYRSPDTLAAIAAQIEAQRNAQMQADFALGPEYGAGDLGFNRSTGTGVGGPGGVNVYSPWFSGEPGEANDPSKFNPFLGGYMSGDTWKPYETSLPDKIVQTNTSLTPGQAVGPFQQFANGRSSVQGQPKPQTPFSATAGDARESPADPFTGFQFGNNGSLGTMQGQFSSLAPGTSSQFFAQQPSSVTQSTPGLGTFQPWQNQSMQALQQLRSQP